MGAQRRPKVEFTTEQQLIDAAIKEGRCTLQDVSMKAIGRQDARLQPRVERINMDHVRKLAAIRKSQGFIAPIVVFDDEKARKMYVPSGWHRLEEHRIAREPSIRAYVIKGDWDEAVEFAAATNQETLLPRTPDDIKKQVYMLFDIPRWFDGGDPAIARHVGVVASTVGKYRAMYCQERGVAMPQTVVLSNGVVKPRFPGRQLPRIAAEKRGKSTRFTAFLSGKKVGLGTDKHAAEVRLNEVFSGSSRKVVLSSNSPYIDDWLHRREIVTDRFNLNVSRYPGISGFYVGDCACVTADVGQAHDLPLAVGRLMIVNQLRDRHISRAIIVCYPEDGATEMIGLARRIEVPGIPAGIEFLTPEQLVASIKGDDSDDLQASPAPPAPDEPSEDDSDAAAAYDALAEAERDGTIPWEQVKAEMDGPDEPDDGQEGKTDE